MAYIAICEECDWEDTPRPELNAYWSATRHTSETGHEAAIRETDEPLRMEEDELAAVGTPAGGKPFKKY